MGNSSGENFSFALNAGAEFTQALTSIGENAKKYRDAIDDLMSYFNEDNLWKGADAQALLLQATNQTDGPLVKLKVVADELDNLTSLANELKGSVDLAQTTLAGNVNTALGNGGGES